MCFPLQVLLFGKDDTSEGRLALRCESLVMGPIVGEFFYVKKEFLGMPFLEDNMPRAS